MDHFTQIVDLIRLIGSAGVVCLAFLTNRRRVIRLTGIDQFIMSYGGLRGGIAFCLSLLIDGKVVQEKNMFVTTTILVVFFTVFIQVSWCYFCCCGVPQPNTLRVTQYACTRY